MGMGIEELIAALIQAADVLKQFAVALCMYGIGWGLFISAGWRLVKYGDARRQYTMASVGTRALVGSLLIQASEYVNSVVQTVTGASASANNAMSVMPASGSSVPMMVFQAALAWLGALGVIAILRGATLMVKAGDSAGGGQGSEKDPLWTGFVFMFSGALGVNLWRFTSGLM